MVLHACDAFCPWPFEFFEEPHEETQSRCGGILTDNLGAQNILFMFSKKRLGLWKDTTILTFFHDLRCKWKRTISTVSSRVWCHFWQAVIKLFFFCILDLGENLSSLPLGLLTLGQKEFLEFKLITGVIIRIFLVEILVSSTFKNSADNS